MLSSAYLFHNRKGMLITCGCLTVRTHRYTHLHINSERDCDHEQCVGRAFSGCFSIHDAPGWMREACLASSLQLSFLCLLNPCNNVTHTPFCVTSVTFLALGFPLCFFFHLILYLVSFTNSRLNFPMSFTLYAKQSLYMKKWCREWKQHVYTCTWRCSARCKLLYTQHIMRESPWEWKHYDPLWILPSTVLHWRATSTTHSHKSWLLSRVCGERIIMDEEDSSAHSSCAFCCGNNNLSTLGWAIKYNTFKTTRTSNKTS